MNFINSNLWLKDPYHTGESLGPVSCFRKKFQVTKAGNAVLIITAMGLFEAALDGKEVTDELFAPGWFDYRKRAEYRNYTIPVFAGEHTLTVLLADGWYGGKIVGKSRDIPRLLVNLVLPDGSVIACDETWECSNDGPILYSDIYEGEAVDLNRNWTNWHPVKPEHVEVELEPFRGNPVKRILCLKPVSIKGNIVDFGQNLTGRERIRFTAPKGQKITIRHAEVLNPDGSLYTENLRKSKSTNIVISSDGTAIFESHFSFHGFRYLEVTGADSFEAEAILIRSDYPLHFEFDCSNPLLNRLVSNISWGWQDNSLDVPTDCPQRDERVGWMGDAQVFIRAASYLSDCTKFFRRWLKDVRLCCSDEGVYSIVAPYIGHFCEYNVVGWADAGVICPWVLYEFTGNTDILEENYEMIRKFIVYRRKEFEEGRLPDAFFGDWLNVNDLTDQDVLAAEYLAYSGTLAYRIAKALDRTEDAELFGKWEREYKMHFSEKYFDRLNSQTGMALALRFNLLPEGKRKKCAENLSRLIREKFKTHLSTGFLGTPHLLHALSENGYHELAWELLEQTTFPSWLFPVLNGATTMWEHWDSWTPENGFKDPKMNSFNHYAYGAVLDWIVQKAAGISPDFNIDPQPGGTLSFMDVTFKGLKVRWEKTAGKYHCSIVVPEGITAKFRKKVLPPGNYEFAL